MVWIHPVLQFVATLIGLYAMYLGWVRFQAAHMGRKMVFPWKPHVKWGTVALGIWAAGSLLGLAVARLAWSSVFITGAHAWVGLLMVPLCAVGYLTGQRMDVVKKRRKLLPLVHGANNLLLVVLALWQLWTGIVVVRVYLL